MARGPEVYPAQGSIIYLNEVMYDGQRDERMARFLHGHHWEEFFNSDALDWHFTDGSPQKERFITALVNTALTMNNTDEYQARAVKLRFGIDSGFLMTYRDVGKIMETTGAQAHILTRAAINKSRPLFWRDGLLYPVYRTLVASTPHDPGPTF